MFNKLLFFYLDTLRKLRRLQRNKKKKWNSDPSRRESKKHVSEMEEEELRNARQIWRERKRRQREKKKFETEHRHITIAVEEFAKIGFQPVSDSDSS